MRILSQTNDIKGYYGTIGTPTNMYDYRGEQLFVGDVVCLATFGVDGKKAYDFGIEFVCEENTDIANWTGKNHQYVMGIASTYNNEKFKVLEGVELNSEEWREKFDTIDSDFRVYKVKDHSQLAIGEKITFLSVVDVADCPTEKGRRYRMTDNEIINEWKDEIHRAEYIDSSYCDCIDLILIKNTLDLINRQKEEIERLKNRDMQIEVSDKLEREIKAEAYKEFAEKLNEKARIADCFDSYNMVVGTHFIDDLLKEMVGDNNA